MAKKRHAWEPYWYFIHTDFCPVCGSESTVRERKYTKRPKKWEKRNTRQQVYDYCEVGL